MFMVNISKCWLLAPDMVMYVQYVCVGLVYLVCTELTSCETPVN
jgi:hypothetical protein